MWRALVLVALAACGGTEDGDQPLAYTLRVLWSEPAERPAAAVSPTVYIDGVARTTLEIQYDSGLAAMGEEHVAELRHGDVSVRSYALRIEGSCFQNQDGIATEFRQDLCGFQSGDLRFASDFGTNVRNGTGFTCIGDGFCGPGCGPTSCGTGERCTSRVTSTSPVASHLGCAPIGPKTAGAACAMIPSADGGYDDCGAGLLCLAGVCTAARFDCAGDFIPGHPPELRLCP